MIVWILVLVLALLPINNNKHWNFILQPIISALLSLVDFCQASPSDTHLIHLDPNVASVQEPTRLVRSALLELIGVAQVITA